VTTKELLDIFPETLLQDDRILSARERELLANVLRQARTYDQVPGNRIAETLARAIGETVAQRAFSVLGERVLQGLETSSTRLGTGPLPVPSPPSPDKPGPHPPSPSPPTSPNGIFARRDEAKAVSTSTESSGVAVVEFEETLAANCVIFEEFLVPADLSTLTRYIVEHEADFRISEVISPGVKSGMIDHEHRRSRVLSEPGDVVKALVDRVKACLPRVLPKLGRSTFSVTGVEAQITASNDGDFFRWHSDNGQEEIASREITFVYFFHREPKRFQGGELRIYDSERREGFYFPTENYRAIVPRQNQIVFFRSSLAHEITPVECRSGEFGDSRFTVNGWFHR
jgi:2OG-Fe(II) oxygenase superfamily